MKLGTSEPLSTTKNGDPVFSEIVVPCAEKYPSPSGLLSSDTTNPAPFTVSARFSTYKGEPFTVVVLTYVSEPLLPTRAKCVEVDPVDDEAHLITMGSHQGHGSRTLATLDAPEGRENGGVNPPEGFIRFTR